MFDDHMDDFADEDLSKLTKSKYNKVLDAINKTIAENFDSRTKHVGDKVIVWDSSRLRYFDTDLPVTDNKEEMILANYMSIVIDDSQRYDTKLVTLAGNFSKVLDLKVWNKTTNKVYRTSSEFVKLV